MQWLSNVLPLQQIIVMRWKLSCQANKIMLWLHSWLTTFVTKRTRVKTTELQPDRGKKIDSISTACIPPLSPAPQHTAVLGCSSTGKA